MPCETVCDSPLALRLPHRRAQQALDLGQDLLIRKVTGCDRSSGARGNTRTTALAQRLIHSCYAHLLNEVNGVKRAQ
jgi:hypothetical protein